MNGVTHRLMSSGCAPKNPVIPVTSVHSLRADALSDRGPVWNVAQRARCAMPQSRSGGQQPSMQTSSDAPSCELAIQRVTEEFQRFSAGEVTTSS